MDSSIITFNKSVAQFLTRDIIDPISKYLKGKGMDVTTEELLKVLEVPYRAPMNAPVSVSNGYSSNPLPVGRSMPRPAEASSGCVYEFQRGKKVGQKCELKTIDNSIYCRSHHKIKNGAGSEGSTPRKTPNGTINMGSTVKPAPEVPVEDEEELRLSRYKETGNFINKETGVLFKIVNEEYVAYGCDDGSGVIKRLSEENKAYAIAKGCSVDESQSQAEPKKPLPTPTSTPLPLRSRAGTGLRSISSGPGQSPIPPIPQVFSGTQYEAFNQ